MGSQIKSAQEVISMSTSEPKAEEKDMDARVQATWETMNKGLPSKNVKPTLNKPSCSTRNNSSQNLKDNWMTYLGIAPKKTGNLGRDNQHKETSDLQNGTNNEDKKKSQKKADNWMSYLGLATKKTESTAQDTLQKGSSDLRSATSDEATKLAAAPLSAVEVAAAAASSKGKVEITEVRDIAGKENEVKKLVDAESREATDKARGPVTSAVDAVLEQIKKKPKLSVLDKTKKDWGEFKEENKGLEEELDAYKKSSNQYLDKVSFLKRADYREFEKERDARLALQVRRRTDMREDDL